MTLCVACGRFGRSPDWAASSSTQAASLRTEDGIDVWPVGKFFDAVSRNALF
ncbi:MAG TPA: hypothetical protein VEO02_03230 [Thermoanaerobaculia bacterium]|nr:hypothetical protein [Thermoanaerobaculia bacterium]